MSKRLISLILTVLILISCTSCGNDSTDYYIDDDSVKYMVCRDSDGEMQIGDSGKLLVYDLNENGKRIKTDSGDYITKYVDFNGQIVAGRNVEIAEMKFTLPANFVEDRANPGYFNNSAYNGDIFIFYYDEDINLCVESLSSTCEALLESFGSEVFSYNQYTVNVDGTECTAFEQLCTSSEYYLNAFSYIIPYDSGYYRVDCNISTDFKNKVDFDKFIGTFDLKNA